MCYYSNVVASNLDIVSGLKVWSKPHKTLIYFWPWSYFTPCSSVSIFNFEHVIAGWATSFFNNIFTVMQEHHAGLQVAYSLTMDHQQGKRNQNNKLTY